MSFTPTPPDQLAAVRERVLARYDEEELRTLCADLGVNYDDLPAQGRAGKARELVGRLDRQGRLLELQAILDRPLPVASPSHPSPSSSGDKITVGNIGPGAVVAIGAGASAHATSQPATSAPPSPHPRPAGRATEIASLERQLAQLGRNLMILGEKRTEYIDPRNVPPDLVEAEERTRQEIARIESRLAELQAP